MEEWGALVVDARHVHVVVGGQGISTPLRAVMSARLRSAISSPQLVAAGPQVVVEVARRARVRHHVGVPRLGLVRREGPVHLRAVCAQGSTHGRVRRTR